MMCSTLHRHLKYTIKKALLVCLLCYGFLSLHGQSPSFNTYTNPVIPGDHPDATLTRVGNHFYTTGSSFNPTPVIYHSTDLVHWEAIARPVSESWTSYGDTPGGGCWGGHMVYYGSKYWHYFSHGGSMHFVTANEPQGPWTLPTRVNNPVTLPFSLGYDNSVFIDDDGKWYLVVKNGQPNNAIVELGSNGQPTGTVYNLSWLNPGPTYPYSWAEGPIIWKAHGYYYYSFARDLSGGQKVMRSTVLTDNQGSWEMLGDFFNLNDPLKASALFAEPNHSSPAIMLDDSTSWVIHPLYAKPEWKGQGRQGLLNQVYYDNNKKPVADYPVNRAFNAPRLSGSGIPWMVPKSDYFNSGTLSPEWSFMGYTPAGSWSLSEKPGWLRLSPKGNGKRTMIVKNDGEHNYSLITRVDFDARATNQEAGLIIVRGDEAQHVRLFSAVNSNGVKVISFSYVSTRIDSAVTMGNTAWLKLTRVNHTINGYFSADGVNWTQIGNGFDISVIDSYSDFTSFTGTRQGLYTLNGKAWFDVYIYRDAYTPIIAGWPANQYGTIGSSTGSLVNIHHNDWALYAGVEFGGKDYGKAAESVSIQASSASEGIVEMWLDSIETGNLIGTCTITSTGNLSTFNTFTASVSQITGRHDLYLRFTGSGGELFRIKSLQFVPKLSPRIVSSYTSSDSTITMVTDKPMSHPLSADGLSVLVNDVSPYSIDDIYLNPSDSANIVIRLDTVLIFSDAIRLSYVPGNLMSPDGLLLMEFNNIMVQNNVKDPSPKIIDTKTNSSGDSLVLEFNKKMQTSPAPPANWFLLKRNSTEEITVDTAFWNDTSTFVLAFHPQVFFEDSLTLSYNGETIMSESGFLLLPFSDFPVDNVSNGYNPELVSAHLTKVNTVYAVSLKFDRLLAAVSNQMEYFTVEINGQPVFTDSITALMDSVRIYFSAPVQHEDIITLSYAAGNIVSVNNGKLEDFTGYNVQNNIPSSIRNPIISNVNVFPVPFTVGFTINADQNFNRIEIYNHEGRLVFNNTYHTPVNNARVKANLPPGPYILVIYHGLTAITMKITCGQN